MSKRWSVVLAFVLAAASAALGPGCAAGADDEGAREASLELRARDAGQDGEACPEQVTLEATRTYRPTRSLSGSARFSQPTALVVPSEVLVVEGASARGIVELTFERARGPRTHCLYRGTRPGTRYVLSRCTGREDDGHEREDDGDGDDDRGGEARDREERRGAAGDAPELEWDRGSERESERGARAGSLVVADEVVLRVLSGDARHPAKKTKVRGTLETRCGDGGSDAQTDVAVSDAMDDGADDGADAGADAPVCDPRLCDNGDPCDCEERCSEQGQCVPGEPPRLDDQNPCTTDSCDAELGVLHVPASAGTSCGGNVCAPLVCDGAGACVSAAAPEVDDGNPCTIDACDPQVGVLHTPVAAGIACGGDACDAELGVMHVPVADGTPCNNATVCDGLETCQAGVCTPGVAPVIDARSEGALVHGAARRAAWPRDEHLGQPLRRRSGP